MLKKGEKRKDNIHAKKSMPKSMKKKKEKKRERKEKERNKIAHTFKLKAFLQKRERVMIQRSTKNI